MGQTSYHPVAFGMLFGLALILFLVPELNPFSSQEEKSKQLAQQKKSSEYLSSIQKKQNEKSINSSSIKFQDEQSKKF